MLLLLGGSGYVGSAFRKLFDDKSIAYRSISRKDVDYTCRESVIGLVRETKATFLINAAGYTGKPNVDACELHKADCLLGNAVLPAILREACEQCDIPWGHVSSGCIYTGSHSDGSGFTELNKPNFSFRTNNCSFYSGCKALGEECLEDSDQTYIWRLRIPFNHLDSGRNYLSKLMNYTCLLDATNSVSHLDEFVAACWQTWEKRIPFGVYNITNTGSITTRQVVELIKRHLKVDKEFKFFESEEQFMHVAAKTPRSNCVLDNSKILKAGIGISHVTDAIEKSLKQWTR